MPTPTSSTTSAAQVAASGTSTRAKRSPRLYTPGKGDTAKNICGREWKLANPDGTEREFDTYWKAPENSDTREQFTNKENELTAAKKAMRATRVRAGAA
ncbi:hypothetical protein OF83DRAFT_1288345 [Amylostereum chailletii]|nr:hypothetical protein OF83DRAFT_1288345 [Amylostereum chailletii]